MHKFLILVYENDENGNKKQGVEPQYFYLDDEMKVRETYKKYRNQYQTTEEVDENGNVTYKATGIKRYTLELCKGTYVKMSTSEADTWVDSLIKNA